MERIAVKTKAQLRKLVVETFNRCGPGASLNHLDVSALTDFSYVFHDVVFCGDASSWDTTRAQNMQRMFAHATLNTDISMWNLSGVKDTSSMFESAKGSAGPLGRWCTGSWTDTSAMFAHSGVHADVSQWDVGQVTTFARMFQDYAPVVSEIALPCDDGGPGPLLNLSQWNTASAISLVAMFENCGARVALGPWDVRQVRSMANLFKGHLFQGDISHWQIATSMVDGMLDPDSLAMTPPGIGHWLTAIAGTQQSRLAWMPPAQRVLFDAHYPTIVGVGASALEGARLLDRLWKSSGQGVQAESALVLPDVF